MLSPLQQRTANKMLSGVLFVIGFFGRFFGGVFLCFAFPFFFLNLKYWFNGIWFPLELP